MPDSPATLVPPPVHGEGGSDTLRVGVDLVAVADVGRAVERLGDRYLSRLYTPGELADCRGARGIRLESLAARFAAKEAVLKVLRPSGSRPEWRDIEVCRSGAGWCEVRLHGEAARLAEAEGVAHLSISLSHEAGMAVAVAAGTGRPDGHAGVVSGKDDRTERSERTAKGRGNDQR